MFQGVTRADKTKNRLTRVNARVGDSSRASADQPKFTNSVEQVGRTCKPPRFCFLRPSKKLCLQLPQTVTHLHPKLNSPMRLASKSGLCTRYSLSPSLKNLGRAKPIHRRRSSTKPALRVCRAIVVGFIRWLLSSNRLRCLAHLCYNKSRQHASLGRPGKRIACHNLTRT